jgi:uncharacterized protein YyaL (SSP411 family)
MRYHAAMHRLHCIISILFLLADIRVCTGSDQPRSDSEPKAPAMSPSEPSVHESRNRLADEASPYLRQHRHNPVHWWPWGDAAFEAARAQNKPIFLSIGYSTCYWCHVMERESFENQAVADILNEHFISIKVDREERPDVDTIYMAAVQLMNQGQGGWPMSVFLEPQHLRPFLAGTYFPPDDAYGRPGFKSLLTNIAGAWQSQHDQIIEQAQHVADAVRQNLTQRVEPVPVEQAHIQRAVVELLGDYDRIDGGFPGSPQRAPKFPSPANLDVLMLAAWDNPEARAAVLHTLDRMAMGGMYDQVGGGFHRYSVDARWLVPHFEKMLYDNGMLASTYSRAYELTVDPLYAAIAREICEYVLREMTDETGAYFSAQDAEVNAREGLSYLWSEPQINEALPDADAAFARRIYGLDRGTNFQDPHHPDDPPANVLYLVDRPEKLAASLNMDRQDFERRVVALNRQLLQVRDRREQPFRDEKILVGWNGLMIAGMADAGRILREPTYVDAAQRAADAVLVRLRRENGTFARTALTEVSDIDAFFEDYAYFIHGLLALHRATGNPQSLAQAGALAAIARNLFWDDVQGGYFDARADQSDLFVRTKSTYDGAIPCGNSVMLHNLVTLYTLTGKDTYRDDARRTLDALSPWIARAPRAAIWAVAGADQYRQAGLTNTVEVKSNTSASPSASAAANSPVTVTVRPDHLDAAGGPSQSVTLVLAIADGYHVTAHEPGFDAVLPLEIELVSADASAIRIEPTYPLGAERTGPLGVMRIHAQQVEIPVRIENIGTTVDAITLRIRYQACTESACLAPATDTITIPVR